MVVHCYLYKLRDRSDAEKARTALLRMKDHIKEIQQSSGFLAIKVNDNQLKMIEKRVVAISSKLVAEQKKKSRKPLV